MFNKDDLTFHALEAISAIDGRHRLMTAPLANFLSEGALLKYRLLVEVEYIIALSELHPFPFLHFPMFATRQKQFLRDLITDFSLEDAKIIQQIDRFGYNGAPPVNHDVKAVEYFLKLKLTGTDLESAMEMVHFGLTSEDVNNLAYNLMLRNAITTVYLPALEKLLNKLAEMASTEKATPMLGRTHGQPATPTTFGKEMANFLERLRQEYVRLRDFKLHGKLNGAVGCHNAQVFAAPEVDWIDFAEKFVEKFGFEPNLLTTQIEPHDGLIRLFSILFSINNIIRDLATDSWLYVSADYLMQKNVAGEVGSSTMPHKINPWRMEVAEGSSVEANAKLMGFMTKLQLSRLQRDLSDHEAQRGMGVGVAHSLLAVLHATEELERLTVNRQKMLNDLVPMGEVLTEAMQTLLRREGFAKPYEFMKNLSRGRHCTVEELHATVDALEIPQNVKDKLKSLRPEQYLGLATRLVDIAVARWEKRKESTL